MMKTANRSMLEGPLFRNIILYTIPVMLTGVLQLLFNAADLVIVGRFCGSISVAAVGATGAITNLIVNLFVGLSVGAGVTVAHGLGGEDDEVVSRTVHTAVPTALITGLILAGIGIGIAKPVLQWMDTPDNVLPLSAIYMQIYFAGMPFSMLYNFCASILRAAWDTKSPLAFLSLAGVVNVLLNIVFVTQLHMNVAGVALATILSQVLSALLVLRTLMRREDSCRFAFREMHIYKPQLMKMIRIGMPAGVQGSMFAISNVIIQSALNGFGDACMSGNAAAGNIEGFLYIALNSFHQASVNFIGQNVGAMQYKRVNKILGICMGCVTVMGLVCGVGIYLGGETLLCIYITDSPEAIAYGMRRLLYVAIPYFLLGMMDVSTGALRGLGASISPMLISILGVCGIRIAWIYTIFTIPKYHVPESLYVSYIVSWTATLIAQMIAYRIIYKKSTRYLEFEK
jgi:putative MATE family efflux protein